MPLMRSAEWFDLDKIGVDLLAAQRAHQRPVAGLHLLSMALRTVGPPATPVAIAFRTGGHRVLAPQHVHHRVGRRERALGVGIDDAHGCRTEQRIKAPPVGLGLGEGGARGRFARLQGALGILLVADVGKQ